jgi:hypothetical protein
MSDLLCYCCAEPIKNQFAIVSMTRDVDRVFVAKIDHLKRMGHLTVIVHVQRMEPPKEGG